MNEKTRKEKIVQKFLTQILDKLEHDLGRLEETPMWLETEEFEELEVENLVDVKDAVEETQIVYGENDGEMVERVPEKVLENSNVDGVFELLDLMNQKGKYDDVEETLRHASQGVNREETPDYLVTKYL